MLLGLIIKTKILMTDKISDDLALALIAKGFPADRTIYADGRIRIHSYITIADVVMWFHQYGIWIVADFGTDWISSITPCGYKGKATIEELYYHNEGFNSPSEAYLDAVNYLLNKETIWI